MYRLMPKLLVWGDDIEAETIQQAGRTSRLPFVPGHVALMPDAHVGMGATVGSVIPTEGAIIPSAIGVDIGCGMIAVRTPLLAEHLPDDLSKLHSWIEMVVPAGVGKGFEPDRYHALPKELAAGYNFFTDKQRNAAVCQYGTLGSGNHFVEICLDEEDRVWVVLHSGSRGVGNQLAQGHITKAKKLMKEYFIKLEDPDLAYLVQGTPEFEAYIGDMLWAQDYAAGNREVMMNEVLLQLRAATLDFVESERVNCHHNFTKLEYHHGKDLWITRKGAIKAGVDDRGVIPGSMGTATYIVRGLGNKASYNSCSHGAGRRLSRSAAKRELTEESLAEKMSGIAWNGDTKALLDEHPDSYKDIDAVMAAQKDLVVVEHTLHQVLNYKGV